MSRATSLYSFACASFAAAVVALATGGCFSERVAGPGGPSAQELCDGTQPNVVRIRNYTFVPAQLQVPRGTVVTWANCDQDTHTATSDNGVWDSGALTPITKFERVFDVAGTFAYHCEPHPGMRATIVVLP